MHHFRRIVSIACIAGVFVLLLSSACDDRAKTSEVSSRDVKPTIDVDQLSPEEAVDAFWALFVGDYVEDPGFDTIASGRQLIRKFTAVRASIADRAGELSTEETLDMVVMILREADDGHVFKEFDDLAEDLLDDRRVYRLGVHLSHFYEVSDLQKRLQRAMLSEVKDGSVAYMPIPFYLERFGTDGIEPCLNIVLDPHHQMHAGTRLEFAAIIFVNTQDPWRSSALDRIVERLQDRDYIHLSEAADLFKKLVKHKAIGDERLLKLAKVYLGEEDAELHEHARAYIDMAESAEAP